MSGQVLQRDLVAIPDAVHDGDFVLSLAKGVGERSTIEQYVVTDRLAANFDKALGLVKSAVETKPGHRCSRRCLRPGWSCPPSMGKR